MDLQYIVLVALVMKDTTFQQDGARCHNLVFTLANMDINQIACANSASHRRTGSPPIAGSEASLSSSSVSPAIRTGS